MIEALLDPKTWLFALFSALNNVPNSLTNQRQIIVASFGFTTLQTTLLGCVDGVVEIVTIWTGVTIVSQIPNSRAYVAALYTVPNLLGVFLINFLPWHNKVGLLFGQWLTGETLQNGPPWSYFNFHRCGDHQLCAFVSLAFGRDRRPHKESDGQCYNAFGILHWQLCGSFHVAATV